MLSGGMQNLVSAEPSIIDLIGKPFADGGRGPDHWDCWGLASEVFRRYGIELPDYRVPAFDEDAVYAKYNEVKTNYDEVSGELPVPCLIFMRFESVKGSHVGVYLGNGRFIHARVKTGVKLERLTDPMFRRLVIGAYLPR